MPFLLAARERQQRGPSEPSLVYQIPDFLRSSIVTFTPTNQSVSSKVLPLPLNRTSTLKVQTSRPSSSLWTQIRTSPLQILYEEIYNQKSVNQVR
jgi:hypothetical protein